MKKETYWSYELDCDVVAIPGKRALQKSIELKIEDIDNNYRNKVSYCHPMDEYRSILEAYEVLMRNAEEENVSIGNAIECALNNFDEWLDKLKQILVKRYPFNLIPLMNADNKDRDDIMYWGRS